ncbi:MAG: hypothetical protein KBD94_08440 [Pyrinomonadaceae bacterium]|nr:hypothetical protein [Pyrinomonadaceae bacterium]
MTRFDSPLKNINIASPCSADWDEMYGDNRKRFCGACKLNVYNLSGMTTNEAEVLITNAEGRLCVRFYRRADGSIITADCPVGWAKIKQRTRLHATAIASLLMALFTGMLFVSLFSKGKATIGDLRFPFPTPTPERLMGAIAMPPKNTNTNAVQGKPSVTNDRRPADTPKTKFEMGKMRVITGEAASRKNG